MKNYILLIVTALPIINIWAGGELQQEVSLVSDKKTAEAIKKAALLKMATSPEYIARDMAQQAVEAAFQGHVSACTDLKTFIDSSARTLHHSILQELEKNMTLCTLLNAFNVITKGHQLPREATVFYEQFRTADEIIKTQVGKDGYYVLDPNTTIAGKSLLHILLHKALLTESYESFEFLLRLAKRLIDKKATIGPEESSLLMRANPKMKPEHHPGLRYRPIPAKQLKEHIDMFKYRPELP